MKNTQTLKERAKWLIDNRYNSASITEAEYFKVLSDLLEEIVSAQAPIENRPDLVQTP